MIYLFLIIPLVIGLIVALPLYFILRRRKAAITRRNYLRSIKTKRKRERDKTRFLSVL